MSDVFNQIAARAEAEAEKIMLEIEVLANVIAEKMQHLHGDRCRFHISHEHGFVMVVVQNR
ncbi:hypothetical protein [Mesorhizobium sp. M8A.F.Ca.ET.021.01.1.1]|uniref:hypothetical protein n=1 Tax=Mesorhizobium sp. M8A.F.Ca.ET.021.01.1.1 TaxID=2496757 RepID=UPI000FCBB6C8|nr:hypothetical protein [Mesorhizobium sp. M8A.F.Ca.ET.021.01.1.1]RUW53736.1 hypothetical protein EOA36_10125 [Mesorhizobium sp. M8A.F.Ca.ET.021.01.1.1]